MSVNMQKQENIVAAMLSVVPLARWRTRMRKMGES